MKYLVSRNLVIWLIVLSWWIIYPVQAQKENQIIATIRSTEPQDNAGFGQSLAMSGDIVVVGEPGANVEDKVNAGKAYIFDSEGNLLKTLNAKEPEPQAYFGQSVAASQDIVVIGEPVADEINRVDAGRAYIFDSEGNLLKTLRAPEPQAYANFGRSVAVNGDIIVIGEPGANVEDEVDAGRAYIFDSEGNLLKTLQANESQAFSNFGQSVAVNQDIIIVGEYSAEFKDGHEAGRAYIFDSEGNLLKTLRAPEPQAYANFGRSVAVNGDIVVIGEPGANVEDEVDAGRAYIFDSEGNLHKTIGAIVAQEAAGFGTSVAVDGDNVIVGEPSATVEDVSAAGRVYVFNSTGAPSSITHAPVPQLGGKFGESVVISENTVAIGEVNADVGTIIFAGEVHIIHLVEEEKASFILSNLIIYPSSVDVDGVVTISVEVTNRGGRNGTYDVTLKIDGEVEEMKTIALNSNETERVSFEVSAAQPGTISVKVNGLSGSYTVTTPIEDNDKPFRGIFGFPFEFIALGIIGGIFLLWLIFTRRRKK